MIPFSADLKDAKELIIGVLGKFWPDKADEEELGKMVQAIEDVYVRRIEAGIDLAKAEMRQGDNYTKRMRPTIGYGGLFLFIFKCVIVPLLNWALAIGCVIAGYQVAPIPDVVIPTEIVVAWTSLIGIYTGGRTFEKLGASGKLVKAITGN